MRQHNIIYVTHDEATSKNDGVKMAQRWCRGSKDLKYQKSCLGPKTCYEKLVNSYQ